MWAVQFEISDFGFEMQDSSNFEFPLHCLPHFSRFGLEHLRLHRYSMATFFEI